MSIDIFLENLGFWWHAFSTWHPPKLLLHAVIAFSLASAWIVTHFTNGSKMFSMPISFFLLFFVAMVSNFAFRDFRLHDMQELQKIMVLTLAGHSLAVVALLYMFKVNETGPR